jgi:hypothetical protein
MRFRLFRLALALMRHVCRAALRAFITALVFLACTLAALSYMGVPLPSTDELLERFESISQLARILS